jgi:hypothetical protein
MQIQYAMREREREREREVVIRRERFKNERKKRIIVGVKRENIIH